LREAGAVDSEAVDQVEQLVALQVFENGALGRHVGGDDAPGWAGEGSWP